MASAKTMQTDLRKLNRLKKIKKRVKKLIAVLLFVAVVTTVWFTRAFWLPFFDGIAGRAGDIIVNNGKVDGGNFPLSFGETGQVILSATGNSIRLLTDTHITLYDEDGKKENSFLHGYSSAIVESSGKYSLVYDLGGYSYMVVNKSKIAYQNKLDDQILYANVSSDGYCAIVTKTDKYIAYLTIYDQYGEEIFHWSCGRRIIDVSFSGDSTGCFATTVSASKGAIVSTVTALDFSKENTLYDTLMQETLVIETKACTNRDLWAIGDDRMFRLKSNGEILYRYDYPNTIECFDVSSELAAFSFEKAVRDNYSLVIQSGSEQSNAITVDFDTEIRAISCVVDKVYVLTSKQLIAYDKSGAIRATCDVDNAYNDFVVIDDYCYLLGYHKIDRITYKT